MRAKIDYIQCYFDTFNQLIFEGKLPTPRFRITHAKTYLARMSFKRYVSKSQKDVCTDFTLSFSEVLDLPEETIQDTLIHEMIHLHIGYQGIKDTSSHGLIFRRMMEDINLRFKRHISISHDITDEERATVRMLPRWRVVAVVKMCDERTGIKVLPRVKSSIASYYQRVKQSPEVHSIQLFNSRHPYFERFPCSAAARVHFVEGATIEEALKDAQPIQVTE